MQLILPATYLRRRLPYVVRGLLYWVVVVALGLQLIAATLHHHNLAQQSDNCVACYVNVQASGNGPAVTPNLAMAVLIAAYCITPSAYCFFYPQFHHHLLPCAQAPPLA